MATLRRGGRRLCRAPRCPTRRPPWRVGLGIAFLLTLVVSPALAQSREDPFTTAVSGLPDASFSDKEAILVQLNQSGHPNVRVLLTAWLEDRLYARASDRRVFIVKKADEALASWEVI